jgi:exonuclease III
MSIVNMESKNKSNMTLDGSSTSIKRISSHAVLTGRGRKTSYWRESLEGEIPGPEGGLQATGNRIQTRKSAKVGTWNVRSLIEIGKLEMLEKELEAFNIQLCGLSEVWWKGKGHFTTDAGHKVIFSGEENQQRKGVGFWLHKSTAKCLISYEPVNSRMMSVSIRAAPQNLTLIQVYAPTAADTQEEHDRFFGDLQRLINKASKRSVLFVMGDFNAKVGEGTSQLPVIGPYGLGERNEAGSDLVEFCIRNELSITNTLFQHPKRRRYTWKAPGNRARNQIDYIMIHQRWRKSIRNCRTYPGADCNSDHNLLVATFKLRLKARQKHSPILRFDLDALKGSKGHEYATEVSNQFEALNLQDEEIQPESLWNKTKEIVIKAASKIIPLPKNNKKNEWISVETTKKAEEKRLESNPDKHRQLKAEVQRLVRQDREAHTAKVCEQIQADALRGNSRSLFKQVKSLVNDKKVTLNLIKDKNGEAVTEPKGIASRWKEYTEELYRDSEERGPSRPPVNTKEPPPLKGEVAKAMEALNLGKAPGADDVPIELLRFGGSKALDVMHRICEDVWETGEWPTDWGLSTFIPIPKKGDLSQCANYRTISLVSHASKILLRIILNRIKTKTEQELPDEQAGFRPGRGTRDQITNLRVIMSKLKENQQPLYMCFIDFQKAFDSVKHEKLWWAMLDMGYPAHLVDLLAKLYKSQKAAVRVAGEISEWFSIQKGVRQGCVLSPYLFNVISEVVMRKALEGYKGGITIGGRRISNLRYADDIVLLASTPNELQELVDRIATVGKEYNLLINISKTKVMTINGQQFCIKIENKELEQVTKFPYLGSWITEDAKCKDDIRHRLALGNAVSAKLKTLWQSHALTLKTKVEVCKTLIWAVVSYGCESWTLDKESEKRLQAFEMKTLRRMLGVKWQDHRTNESILQETSYTRLLVPNIKKRKLRYVGHISRKDESLEKTIMQGKVEGKRGRGRPRRTWMNDVTEWTSLSVHEVTRKAKDRQEWRKIVNNAA